MPAGIETGFQIGYVLVECVDSFFVQIDGVDARRGEKEGLENQRVKTAAH